MSDKPYLPYRQAKKYLVENGIEFDDSNIDIASHFNADKVLQVRKAYALSLLEDHNLLDDFSEKYWPGAKTKSGLTRINKYKNVKQKNEELLESDEENSTDVEIEDSDTFFELEYQLRDFIAHNLGNINLNGKKLSLYIDENGRNGVEYPSGVGPIDILAQDTMGNLYVFELKRSSSPDKAIGQVARYMGCLKSKAKENTQVFGVIVAREITENLKYAVNAIQNVTLFEYSISFTLNEVNGYITS